jgi:hypothetical protein
MKRLFASVIIIVMLIMACSKSEYGVIQTFPLDNLDGVIAQSNVAVDTEISSDGKGSLRVETSDAATVPLFEVVDPNVENARIFYQARLRTENVIGQVYLEMWVRLPGLGESFSRGQQTLLTGTTDWTSQEIPFFLQKGQNPDLIKLNLVINGQGRAWIDDIKLIRGPLK